MKNQQIDQKFTPFAKRMRDEQLPEIVIETFKFYYKQLLEGKTGFIPEGEIRAVESLPDLEKLPASLSDKGKKALNKTVVLVLNGGLGTSMGLDKAKSLLPIKNGFSFLDILALQALNDKVRLLLMNSFSTNEYSRKKKKKYPALWRNDFGISFTQHKVPKINSETLEPALWPSTPDLEWCPPGHGDIYTALQTSGIIDKLLELGFEYAFVSNADNLGAVINTTLLGYFVDSGSSFLMEVADRTISDKKGGHLAKTSNGSFLLRESAQCPPENQSSFEDIGKHKYFNTNNLWIHLPALKRTLIKQNNILGLPLILNAKTVDPRNPDSTKVYQLETAMGSAISVFEDAGAIRVPRSRFAPVKTTNDLFVVRSDVYQLTKDFKIIRHPELSQSPHVHLDPSFYKFVDQLEKRFPEGIPSMLECRNFSVKGDFLLYDNIKLQGDVTLINEGEQQKVIENMTLSGEYLF